MPPLVTQGTDLAQDLPNYASDVQDFVNKNEQLRKLDEKYDITGKLNEQAAEAAEPARRRGRACSATSGSASVNSVFALVNDPRS